MYTCVVLIEAWPSSSCTARMSAPWSSMWVAQEWRSTWGLSRPASPTRSPWRLQHVPRALAGEPAAAGVQEHRLGVATSAPLRGRERRTAPGPEPGREGPRGGRADGHDPLLAPLAEGPQRATASRSTSPSESPTSSEIRTPVP